jgi:hypothetical protein
MKMVYGRAPTLNQSLKESIINIVGRSYSNSSFFLKDLDKFVLLFNPRWSAIMS